MSRFFRGGRHALQSALQQGSRANRRPTAAATRSVFSSSASSGAKFSITFTSAAQMQSALQVAAGAPAGSSGGSALGSVRSLTSSSNGASSAGPKAGGCGAASCCGGSGSLVLGEDDEEPFIGTPSLSSSSSSLNSASVIRTEGTAVPLAQSNKSSTTCSTGGSSSDSAASAAAPPPPRTKCDPFEQGGHPLSTDVVLHHLRSSLESGWTYDADRRHLSRTFDFRREFNPQADPASQDDLRALMSFTASLGNMALHAPGPGGHSFHNVHQSLWSRKVQVVLRTPQLRGLSFHDLALATKAEGAWFRLKMERDERREQQLREAKRTRAQ